MSDLDDIMAGKDPEPELDTTTDTTPEQEAKPSEPEPPEPSEEGKTPDAPVKEPAKADDDANGMVPAAVVADLRRQLRELKAGKQEAPKPEPMPDAIDDPAGFQRALAQQLEGATTRTKLELSRYLAEQEFGAEAVQDAIEYFDQPEHAAQSRQFLSKPSPFHEAVKFVRAQKAVAEIGDPQKWIADQTTKIREQVLAELKAEMATNEIKAAAGKPAPSLANANGSGGASPPGWSGPVDLDALLG